MKKTFLFTLAVASLCLGGCKEHWDKLFAPPELFIVQSSSLNWLEILYKENPEASSMRLSMYDSRVIHFEQGSSSLIEDSFAHDYKTENWGNRRVKVSTIPEIVFDHTLQSLINAGLFKFYTESDFEEEELPEQKILIKGNINNKKIDCYAFDKDLIREIESVLHLYGREVPNL